MKGALTNHRPNDAAAQCEPEPAQRVVLLGASNLTKAMGTVLARAEQAFGGPLEVLGAFGHGRSYGKATRVLGLELPGIDGCGLWRDLAAAPERPTAALVTDIGNDLIYEEPVERIAGWIERTLDRLAEARAATTVTLWPIENLRTLSRPRYYLMRSLLVPRSRISLAEISRRAIELDARIERLAGERRMRIVRLKPEWYGFDPIHLRLSRRSRAWREILAGWTEVDRLRASAARRVARALYLRTRTPHACRRFGFELRGRQPAARFADGTTVAIY